VSGGTAIGDGMNACWCCGTMCGCSMSGFRTGYGVRVVPRHTFRGPRKGLPDAHGGVRGRSALLGRDSWRSRWICDPSRRWPRVDRRGFWRRCGGQSDSPMLTPRQRVSGACAKEPREKLGCTALSARRAGPGLIGDGLTNRQMLRKCPCGEDSQELSVLGVTKLGNAPA